ncbi:hypothetical protein C0995_000044 [Termitomyces sp. Mi166|nr:hypothetical protein C0995_000044 [Termitomyces sp. Mi166\
MPPPNRPMNLMQTLIDSAEFSLLKLPIRKVKELEIDHNTFAEFDHAKPIGISPGYSSTGKLISLAIADDKICVIVEFNVFNPRGRSDRQNINRSALPRNLGDLQEKILCRPAGELFAFDMGPLCLSIYADANLRVTNAVDIQSGLSAVDRKPLTAIKEILGTSVTIKEQNVITVFYHPTYDPEDRKSATDLAQRAWISQLLAVYGDGAVTLGRVPRIDTQKLSPQKLETLAKNTNDTLRQNLKKPMKTKHDASISANGQDSTVMSSRFSSKLRSDQNIIMVTENASGSQHITRGQVGHVKGRIGPLQTNRPLDGKVVLSVISIGRDDPTTAEAQRAATVLRVLQGYEQLMNDSPWIQNIFYPSDAGDALPWPLVWSQFDDTSPALDPVFVTFPAETPLELLPLNSSQQDAVNTMCSPLDAHRITIIQGPPGTGKTSVIASFVQHSTQMGNDGIWLVAQSNVAVKNMAEKLIKAGFLNWRLLVSKDFIFEWHDHIYAQNVREKIIISNRFKFVSPKDIKGCKVMLCTLSMLSHINIGTFTSHNPIKTLIVDEASQIEINNYVSVLVTSSKLRKMCFIGDDRQLPPFGQEDLQDLQSIFEVPHLRPHALFLDTQYRMPPQIGDIISDLVYDGKLKSSPLHPITNTIQACYFIDISGQEERNENSYINLPECDAVIELACKLQEQQKAYQIITPYDSQRSTIESKMKQTPNLVWENKCFNVDSFQGSSLS